MTHLPGVRIHVHERGDRSLDGILKLIDAASQASPLEEMLRPMCAETAAVANADVVSAYVREHTDVGDSLVMRANVGFPHQAIGTVTLRVGEGITGFVAECMRPVTVAVAARDRHYKHIAGIDEEKYPSFLGVPLLDGATSVGVLVMQRRGDRPFSHADVALATALAAPFAFALERHNQRQQLVNGDKARTARLRGTPVVSGDGMGRAILVPTLSSFDVGTTRPVRMQVGDALDIVARDFEKARQRFARSNEASVVRALDGANLLLEDTRLRDHLVEAVDEQGLMPGLLRVARDYARHSRRGGDTLLTERARSIEDLCVLVYAIATGRRFLHAGGVLVAQRLSGLVAACALSRKVAAFVIDGDANRQGPGVAVARAAGIPVMAEVEGLFAWARSEDLLVLEGNEGVLHVNPSTDAVAAYRSRLARGA